MFHKTSLTICNVPAELHVPDSFSGTVVYLLSGHADDSLLSSLNKLTAALVFISVPSWNDDMTPWKADKVFKSGEDFGGKADAFLKLLTESICPAVEEQLPGPVLHRGLIGYSLSGLFSLYALFSVNAFERIASLSGSLWYPDFVSFVKEHEVCSMSPSVLITLGDREKNTKNPLLSKVETCTEEIADTLSSRGISVTYHLNPGGHGTNAEQRIIEGILFTASDHGSSSDPDTH